MLEAAGFPYVLIDELVPERERVELAELVRHAPDLATLDIEGITLAPLVVRSTLWRLRSGLAARDLAAQRDFQEFVESAAIVATAFSRLLEREKPQAVVMLSGLFFAEAIMSALAAKRGIRVVSYEFPGAGGTVFISGDQPAGLYDMSELWVARGERAPSDAERERVVREMAARRSGGSETWQTYDPDAAAPKPLDDHRKRLALFTNVSWDTAVMLRDIGFTDMYEWLEHVIEWVAPREDVLLDIRVHPGETRMRGFETNESAAQYVHERFPELPEHIRIHDADAAINSYELIDQADVVLVYSSTIGLESVVMGKPTLVSADVHYRSKGFTYDVDGPDHLRSLLHGIGDLTLDREQHDRAITYAHLYFFDAMTPLPSMSERWRGKPVFQITDASALDDDPAIELVCRLVTEAVAA